MLKLKHKSAVRSTNSGGASYRETYYGTRSEVETRSAELAIVNIVDADRLIFSHEHPVMERILRLKE